MSANKNKCEVPLELNDIRQSLNKIEDTGLALDLLQKVEVIETTFTDMANTNKEMREEQQRLKDMNLKLYAQTTAHSITPKPNDNVDYKGVNSIQDIIKHI